MLIPSVINLELPYLYQYSELQRKHHMTTPQKTYLMLIPGVIDLESLYLYTLRD